MTQNSLNTNIKELKLKVVLTGGGSGGHIYPLISVYRAMKKIAGQKLISLDAVYMGPKDNFGEDAFKNESILTIKILAGKLRRYFSLLNFLDIFKFIFGFFQSLYQLWKFMPDVIFSKGGYGALPVVIAANLYKIPVIIHESDTVPGLSNRVAAKFAKRIAISFNKAFDYFPKEKTALVGNPVRTDLLNSLEKDEAKKKLGFDTSKPLIFILGGSQGSQRINDLILETLEGLVRANIQVVHQTGKNSYRQVAAEAKIILETISGDYINYYHAKAFLNEQEYAVALMASDLVIGRAGSGTIFEISAAKKPSILIPLPESAGDHQRSNAYEYAKAGAAIVLEESNVLPNLFISQVIDLLSNQEKMNDLANRANLFSQPNSSEKIAKEVFDMLNINI